MQKHVVALLSAVLSFSHFDLYSQQKPNEAGPARISQALFNPIEDQLAAFRNKDIEKAYNETLSEEFKNSTNLDAFTAYVQRFPILMKHAEVEVKQPRPEGDKVLFTVVLNPDKDAVPVEYMLVEENGQWKIWRMVVSPQYWGAAQALINDLSTMKKPVEDQLKSLRAKDIAKAYANDTSKAFQRETSIDGFREFIKQYPIFVQFTSYDLKEPTFLKGTGTLPAELHGPRGNVEVEYRLGIEEDQWKIWEIKVLRLIPLVSTPSWTPPIQEETIKTNGSEEDKKANNLPMQFGRLDIGTKIDSTGNIVDPTTSLQLEQDEVHINLYVDNGKKGTVVEVMMEHLETHSKSPVISTSLQQSGNTVLSFVFSPPSSGWQSGRYQITVSSSSGLKKTFPFSINEN